MIATRDIELRPETLSYDLRHRATTGIIVPNRSLFLNTKWRATSSSATIHNLPFGLKSFAKPYMTLQKRRRSYWTFLCNFLRRFCEAMSGFAKLLSPKGKLWIVALLLGVKLFNWRAKKHSSTFNVYFPCLRAFRCQTWIRKIDERIVALNYQAIELILLNFLLLNPKGKLWIVGLLVGCLRLPSCSKTRLRSRQLCSRLPTETILR